MVIMMMMMIMMSVFIPVGSDLLLVPVCVSLIFPSLLYKIKTIKTCSKPYNNFTTSN